MAHNDGSHKVALYWRCATDLELFSQVYFPHYCRHPFNDFHREDFKAIQFGERSVRRARGAPRGYAKSTFKALIIPIHDLCYGLEKFIVLISNTQLQANGKLKDIRSEFRKNVNLVSDYRISFPRKVLAETQFVVNIGNHQAMLASFGSGAEIRGIRFGASRPSKIIIDDAENSEDVQNEVLRQKDEDWFFQVVSQIGDENTNIEVNGTILHRDSLLQKILRNPTYNSKVYKAVISWSEREDLWDKWRTIYTNLDNPKRLEDSNLFYEQNKVEMLKGTKVLWPEKESYLYLMKEMVEKGKRAFMKEKQNSPLGPDDAIFSEFSWYQERDDGIFVERTQKLIPWAELQAYGVLDPATGQERAKQSTRSDFTCILTGYHDTKGRLFVHKDWMKRVKPSVAIDQIFEHYDLFKYNKFGVETNLFRNLLLPNIIKERERREKEQKQKIKLPFYDIENTENKQKRIFTLEPKVAHGWILFNRALSLEFMTQLEEFPNPKSHDDGPDALEMLWGLVNNRYKMSSVSLNPMGSR